MTEVAGRDGCRGCAQSSPAMRRSRFSLFSLPCPTPRHPRQIAPGQVRTSWLTTQQGAGPACVLGRSFADVQMGLTQADTHMCSNE